MSAWLDSLTTWLGAHPQWLGLAIFLVACLECLAIAGIVVPGTVLLFAITMLAGSGALGLGETMLLAYIGGLSGDFMSYLLGRHFHQNIRRLPLLRTHPQWIARAELYFSQYGAVSLLIGRYIGPLRPILPMVAGMLDMPLLRFLLISLLASAGWAVAYVLPGWAAGAALRLPLPEGFWPDAAVAAVLLAILVGASAWTCSREWRHASLLTCTLALALLVALLFGWPWMLELDNGLMTLIQEGRDKRLDEIMVFLTRLGDYRTQLAAAVLLIALLGALRQWRAATFATCTLLGTALANGALKQFFARVRPEVLIEPLSSYSFPSGHASAAFAFCLTLGALAGRGQPARWRITWFLLASLPAGAIALSRIYLGVHWPTDVVGGILLAVFFCSISLLLIQARAPLPALPARSWWMLAPGCLALIGGFSLWALSEAMELYRY